MNAQTIIKNRQGFSLVELLVVIAVIGVIASIAIPAMGNVLGGSRETKARKNAALIAVTYNNAIAAGAVSDELELQDVINTLTTTGKKPVGGQFDASIWRISSMSGAEQEAAKVYLNYVQGRHVIYDPDPDNTGWTP